MNNSRILSNFSFHFSHLLNKVHKNAVEVNFYIGDAVHPESLWFVIRSVGKIKDSNFFLILPECGDCDDSHTTNIEHKLRVKLFCNYDKTQRPVKDHKKSAINVRLRYIVRSFDYVSQIRIFREFKAFNLIIDFRMTMSRL